MPGGSLPGLVKTLAQVVPEFGERDPECRSQRIEGALGLTLKGVVAHGITEGGKGVVERVDDLTSRAGVFSTLLR